MITLAPSNLTLRAGSDVALTVRLISASPPTFQWLFEGAPLPGATNQTLALRNLQTSQAGAYAVVVSNSSGSSMSDPGELTILPPALYPGAVDVTFSPGDGADGSILALATMPDGSSYAGGEFLTFDGARRPHLVRLREDGSVYPGPIPAPDDVVLALLPQTDGGLLLGGNFRAITNLPPGLDGSGYGLLARLEAEGTFDSTFERWPCCFSGEVRALAEADDGHLFVGGTVSGSLTERSLFRLDDRGRIDPTFTNAVDLLAGSVDAFALLPDGDIVAGGIFSATLPNSRPRLVRLNADRSVDDAFGYPRDLDPLWGPEGLVEQTLVQGNGALIVAGTFTRFSGTPCTGIVRVLPDGSPDPSFQCVLAPYAGVATLASEPGGRIVIGGRFLTVNGIERRILARLNADGSLDPSFNPDNAASDLNVIHVITRDAQGRYLVGGEFTTANGLPRRGLVRLLGDSPGLPTIVTQPVSRTNALGSSVVLATTVRWTPGTGMQWYHDGLPVPAGTNGVLLLANAPASASGNYHLVASNALGQAASTVARVSIMEIPPAPAAVNTAYRPTNRLLLINDVAFHGDSVLVGANAGYPPNAVVPGLVRLRANGLMEDLLGGQMPTNVYPTVRAILVQPDGAAMLGGHTRGPAKPTTPWMARLLPGGTLDPAFSVGDGLKAVSGADQPGPVRFAMDRWNRVVFGGGFTNYQDCSLPGGLSRIFTHGSPDFSFVPPVANRVVAALALDDQDRIYVSQTGADSARLQRLLPDGQIDMSFGVMLDSGRTVNAWAVQPDGSILLGGNFTQVRGSSRLGLARLLPNGLVDPSYTPVFVSNAVGTVWSPFAEVTVRAPSLASSAGDPYFVPGLGADAAIEAVAVDSRGRIVIGGRFTHVDGVPRRGIARLFPEGRLDPSFHPGRGLVGTAPNGAASVVNAIGGQSDGMLLLGGTFTNIDGRPRRFVARLAENGAVDETYNAALDGAGFSGVGVRSLAIQRDGRAVVGGLFQHAIEPGSSNLVRLDGSGALDPEFSPGQARENTVTALLADSSGHIYVGSAFRSINSPMPYALMRLRSNGDLDQTFVPSPIRIDPEFFDPCFPIPQGSVGNQLGSVMTLARQPDGELVVGGFFQEIQGVRRSHVARLHADGRVDAGFNGGPGPNYNVRQVTVLPGGKVLIAGCFTAVDGVARPGLARLYPDGSIDTNFNVAISSSGSPAVRAIQSTPDGRLTIAGAFNALDERPAPNLGRLLGEIVLFAQAVDGQEFRASIATLEGRDYVLEFASTLPAPAWTEVDRVRGDAQVKILRGPRSAGHGFYRVRVE